MHISLQTYNYILVQSVAGYERVYIYIYTYASVHVYSKHRRKKGFATLALKLQENSPTVSARVHFNDYSSIASGASSSASGPMVEKIPPNAK